MCVRVGARSRACGAEKYLLSFEEEHRSENQAKMSVLAETVRLAEQSKKKDQDFVLCVLNAACSDPIAHLHCILLRVFFHVCDSIQSDRLAFTRHATTALMLARKTHDQHPFSAPNEDAKVHEGLLVYFCLSSCPAITRSAARRRPKRALRLPSPSTPQLSRDCPTEAKLLRRHRSVAGTQDPSTTAAGRE